MSEPTWPRVLSPEERAALTTPNGMPWSDRTMTLEHVERLRHGHLCYGYDCSTCVWLATLDKLMRDRAGAAERTIAAVRNAVISSVSWDQGLASAILGILRDGDSFNPFALEDDCDADD